MRVRLTDLRPEGIVITDSIPLEPLNDRMKEGQDDSVIFTTAPDVSLRIRSTSKHGAAEAIGLLKATYQHPCALCAEDINQDLQVDAHFILQPKEKDFHPDHEAQTDDVGVVHYEGEHIDLEDIIQETLILKVLPYFSPERDSKGNCKLCGKCPLKEHMGSSGESEEKESKDTVSFGDLLANAQKMKKKK